ncbi:MAG: serine hydrolase [Anaerolineales bacterium]|nr:serine hydrolase [Anaerolineales bacterium]
MISNSVCQTIRRAAPLRAQGWQDVDILTYMAEKSIPGASVAVVDGGEIVEAIGFGILEAGQAHPVTTETRFQAVFFTQINAGLQFTFEDGKCSGLLLRQNGEEIQALKCPAAS